MVCAVGLVNLPKKKKQLLIFMLDKTVGKFPDFCVMEYSVAMLHVFRYTRAFLLHSAPLL